LAQVLLEQRRNACFICIFCALLSQATMGSCFSGISMTGKSKLCYWPIIAKNIGPAVALAIGGFDWELGPAPGDKGTGNLWAEWLEQKPSTKWGYLPNLILPGGEVIGSELAILQFLARKNPKLAGSNDKEFLISQELLHQAEELYQKFVDFVPTILKTDKDPLKYQTFMTSTDAMTHSDSQPALVYLDQFEAFFKTVGGSDGKFTSFGYTIGEIKLFTCLHKLALVKPGIVDGFPNLKAFMTRFDEDPKVKAVFAGPLAGKAVYFIPAP